MGLFNMNTPISAKFLLCALLFCCPDPGWTAQAEEMASLEIKMTNIMERVTRMEAEIIAKDEMVEVRDQRIAVLEEEMKSLTGRMDVTEETDVLLRGMADQVRNPPFAFQCAWQDGFWQVDD